MNRKELDFYGNNMKAQVERFKRMYEKHITVLHDSPLGKMKKITESDEYNVGKLLENWDAYRVMSEAQGSLSSLGRIPNIAYDVITASYATSVLPLIAITQTIEEERGMVYFQNVRAVNTKGNLERGELMTSIDRGKVKTGHNYARNTSGDLRVQAGNGTDTEFAINLRDRARSQTIRVYTVDTSTNPPTRSDITSTDIPSNDGYTGTIVGQGVSGTINYDSGQIELTFGTAPTATQEVHISYQIDYEATDDIPATQYYMATHQVMAQIYALKQVNGLLSNYSFSKRFGSESLDDQIAKTLVGEVNAEITGDLIRKMYIGAMSLPNNTVTWDAQAPANVAEFNHRQSFKYSLTRANSLITANAGRGQANFYIGGIQWCAIMMDTPGFVPMFDSGGIGTQFIGTYNGSPVIMVKEQDILPSNVAIVGYKNPANDWEGAAVYAPFMPLVSTENIPVGYNPLLHQQAVACWAATDVIIPNFLTLHVIENYGV